MQDYGSHQFYTIPQVTAGVVHQKLDSRYLFLAYARFLHQTDYDTLKPQFPLALSYDDARRLFIEYEPIQLLSRDGRPGIETAKRGYDGYKS